ncbi:transketolase [Christensenella tenuis]|jgi:transketolase|uniref:Transketolase n=1 Tax=Christensenella tenuis TaxID=2763033 RepID=A0ABR7EJM3_9FIRM|nr:transketolase [Christensenella tenuis]MBC5649209.1 transketolase [Christensenella tenuis]
MIEPDKLKEWKSFAAEIRKKLLEAIASKGVGHVGGSLSIADTLAVLYGGVMNIDPQNPNWEDRDYIVISKGHSGPAMYAALALKGYFPMEMLKTLNRNGTMLPSHTDRKKTPGVDMTTGSLGQGISLAAGLAFADKLNGKNRYTYAIVGDGELDEGQVWEAALFIAHRKLNNLILLIDANGKQLDGTTREICCLGEIEKKFEAFGFHAIRVADGNDVEQVADAIGQAKSEQKKPSAVVLHTVKGAGVSHYEAMANCHSCGVSAQELEDACRELDSLRAADNREGR